MKRNFILVSLAFFGMAAFAQATITVNVPADCTAEGINYFYAPIQQYANAKTRAERGIQVDSVKFENSKAQISVPGNDVSYMYGLNIEGNDVMVYVDNGQNVSVDVTSCNPFDYKASGSLIMDATNTVNEAAAPAINKLQSMDPSAPDFEAQREQAYKEYVEAQKNLIASQPGADVTLLALMNLNGEDFVDIFEALPSDYQGNIVYPLVQAQYKSEKKNLEMEQKQKNLQSGQVEAPAFTLKDLEGKEVSLSDFRGKWVILDFWGSWCPWCIKGFPELKEAYQKYAGKLEIIGIDCRESEAEWRAGVQKYQLPWVNVYNPEGSKLTEEYGVQGYPTKAIVNPEGKIANITVGHDPAFFEVLSSLIGE